MLMTPFAASDPEVADFVSAYESAYSSTPTQFAADGYDTVYAIFNALTYYAEQNGGLDVTDMSYSDLCEIFISVFSDPNFSNDGLTGAGMTWEATGEVSKDPLVYVIEDGAYAKCE
jgi:branched-chain amino acid transport system substrate-binding protein